MTAPDQPKPAFSPGRLTRAGFFTVLPAFGVGGAMGLPVLMSVVGAASFRASLLRKAFAPPRPWLLLLLTFATWTALSSIWSPYENHAQALKLALTLIPGLVFAAAAIGDEGSRRLTLAGGAAAFAVLAVLLAIETIWGMPLNRAASPPDAPLLDVARDPARGIVVLVAMGWGVAGGLFQLKRTLAGWLVLIVATVLSAQFDQQATLLAYALGLIAFAIAFAAPRIVLLTTTGLLAFWMLAAPWLTPILIRDQSLVDRLPPSWAARVGIWDYTCARIGEHLWFGHGLDASRAVTDRIVVRDVTMRGIPVHPHSGSLHVWYETGCVGAALAAATLIAGGWALSRALKHNKPAAAAAAGAIVSIGVIANLSYSMWQEWWLSTMLLAAALVGAIRSAKA